MKQIKIFSLMVFIFVFSLVQGGNIVMAEQNIQMGQRNDNNTEWYKHYPITKAENVMVSGGSDVDTALSDIKLQNKSVAKPYTFVIAGSNSAAKFKKSADYICTGTDDQNIINSVIKSTSKGSIYFTPDSIFNLSANVLLKSDVNLISNGAKFITPNHTTGWFMVDMPIGANNIKIDNVTGFVVGSYVIIKDDSGWETRYITAIDVINKIVTFDIPITKNFITTKNAKITQTDSCIVGLSVQNVNIDGINIDWNIANNPTCEDTNNSQNGIYLVNSSNCIVKNCNILNGGRHGILFYNTTKCKIINCICNGWGEHGIDVFTSWGTATVPTLSDCIIRDCTCNNNVLNGIQLHRGSGVNISGCTCNSNGYAGISAGQESAHSNIIVNNICRSNPRNIYAYNAYNLTISGNVCSDGTIDGIQLEQFCFRVNISDNQLINNASRGISIFNGYENTISGNQLYNNCLVDNDAEILLSGNCKRNLISNNQIIHDAIVAVCGVNEILGDNNDNMIINNIIKGCTTAVKKTGLNSIATPNYVFPISS